MNEKKRIFLEIFALSFLFLVIILSFYLGIKYSIEYFKANKTTNVAAYYNRGNAYLAKGNYDQAISDYTKVLEINPDFADAHNNLGYAYSESGMYKEAIDAFKQAIRIDPDDVSAILALAEIRIFTGNYESTIDSVKKALSLPLDISFKALSLYLKCTAEKLRDVDTSASENELNETLKDVFTISWSFKEIESWLKDADIDDETRVFIEEKTKSIKEHIE